MAIIASTLSKIKSDPLRVLGGEVLVNGIFSAQGHRWRDRKLNPAVTVGMFFLQILHANLSITELLRQAGSRVSASSYCAARMRLPVLALAHLIETICAPWERRSPSYFRGHRVLLADATSVTTPDLPALQEQWPQPRSQKPGCGFPMVKLLGVMNAATGLICQMTLSSMLVHETTQLMQLGAVLRAGDIVLADRGFCSYVNVAILVISHAHSVFRAHQRLIVDFTPHRVHTRGHGGSRKKGRPTARFVKSLGVMDQLVEWVRPNVKPAWLPEAMWNQLRPTMQIRELRYLIQQKGCRTRAVIITTTLLDPIRYPREKIAELYGLRWQVETNFRHLKQTLRMDALKCQTVQGTICELIIYLLVYNLVRMKMQEAAQRQNVELWRISFIDAWRALKYNPELATCRAIVENPVRPDRHQPRTRKRRPKKYKLTTKPRGQSRQLKVNAGFRT